MNVRERLNTATIYARWNKVQLAEWLIEHGTVYPNLAGLLKWSKDDLVNSVTDRVMDNPAYHRAEMAAAPCECRGYDPADPCMHCDTSEGCPRHDFTAYKEWAAENGSYV